MVKSICAKSVWISDLHLGSAGCKVDKLNDFLSVLKCDNLYLVGDIVDEVVLKNSTLPSLHKMAIDKLEALQNSGTKVYYLPGNHDSSFREKKFFFSIPVLDSTSYLTVKNKNLLVFHGDQLDSSTNGRNNKLAKLGTSLYEFFLKLRLRRTSTQSKSIDLARFLKVVVKNIFMKMYGYEKKLLKYLKENNYDGVICGHSHQPKIKTIQSYDYYNSGDWIDNCSLIIENENGQFELIFWDQFIAK